jgi:predicted nuclease of restriction endonuclease-like (RecB) superfamily
VSQKKPTSKKLVPVKPTTSTEYDELLQQIGTTLETGRSQAVQAVYAANLETYWRIGHHIVEFEQGGQAKAEYGTGLINRLAKDLTLLHGKGFSRSSVFNMRQFYLLYQKVQSLTGLLSWTHVVELLKIDDPLERSFYEKQMLLERWSVRELKRQKESGLFLRLAASKDKAGVLKLASRGQIVEHPTDLLREPYIFEFLKIPEAAMLSETELETRLCDHLQQFLLELGKGFTFVGRQYRVTLNNTHYRVDLVFYHRILRCFVLIDLKIDDVQHHDIGQMNLYLGYFAAEENVEGDNPPVGLILSRHKDELLVEYATYGMNSQLFVQKYQLYLPNREELQRELERTLAEVNEQRGD